MIILDSLVNALTDHPQAIRLRRRPISRKTLSNKEVIFGAMTPVLSQISMLLNNRPARFSRYDAPLPVTLVLESLDQLCDFSLAGLISCLDLFFILCIRKRNGQFSGYEATGTSGPALAKLNHPQRHLRPAKD